MTGSVANDDSLGIWSLWGWESMDLPGTNDVPHLPQKRNSMGINDWQAGHSFDIRTPHILQKAIMLGLLKPQF